MKETRHLLVLAAALAIGFAGTLPAATSPYDTPDFDLSLFEADGLSLSPQDRLEIADALAALARDFPKDTGVDADLKEKALAIALRLDPLNPQARATHAALSNGKPPEPADPAGSLADISEILWKQGSRLARPNGEPDDARLAPFLMEISLLAHPDPPAAWLHRYASLVQETPPTWKMVVTLQPADNKSSVRAKTLAALPKPPPAPAAKPTPKPVAKPATPDQTVATIQIPRATVDFVACNSAESATAGTVTLEIRDPSEEERSLFGAFSSPGSEGSFEMKLAPAPSGTPFRGTEIIGSIVRERFPVWPNDKIGELSFIPVKSPPPGELALSLAGSLLVESVFIGDRIAKDVVIAGVLDQNSTPALGAPDTALKAIIESAAGMKKKHLLLVPASVDLTVLAKEDAHLFIKPQLIGYQSYQELRDLIQAGNRNQNLKEAIDGFASIETLTGRMDLSKILQNGAVNNRLQQVLSLWPNHLSAKALLALKPGPPPKATAPGSKPEPEPEPEPEPAPPATDSSGPLSPADSAAQIHETLLPLSKFVKSASEGSATSTTPDELIQQSVQQLKALKPRIDSSSQNLYLSAQKIVKGFQALATVRSPGSSVWNQRMSDLRSLASEYNLEQSALGTDLQFDL